MNRAARRNLPRVRADGGDFAVRPSRAGSSAAPVTRANLCQRHRFHAAGPVDRLQDRFDFLHIVEMMLESAR